MTRRLEQAAAELKRTGHLDRQPDGYWSDEPYKPTRSFGERTILDLIKSGRARITVETKHRRGGTRPTRIEPTGET